MKSTVLLGLPVEIVIAILKWLDCREILLCSSVCKTLRATVKGSLELQYQIELAADGMVDGPPDLMTTADRLELLLDRRRRWRMLDWTRKVMVPIPGACQAYELAGGVFTKLMMAGDVGNIEESIVFRHLIATWLPSRTKEARSIVRDELDVVTREFTIEPSQDLVVLIDADDIIHSGFVIKVYLQTTSTNAAHPGAASSVLRAEISSGLGSMTTRVVDDVIGIFWDSGPGLIIWNWVTAEMLVYCLWDTFPSREFDFLSNRAFMITVANDPGSIEIYTFSGYAPPSVSSPLPPTHIVTLQMPPLQDGREMWGFLTQSGLFVRPTAPFASAHSSRVHFMGLQYNSWGPQFYLFLHNDFLLSLVPPGYGSREAWTPLTRPWDSWGPAHTRILEHKAPFQWSHFQYVHGQRVVLPQSSPPDPLCTLRVLDFNIYPTRTDDPVHTAESRGTTWRYDMVTRPTTVSAGSIFQADVVTHLPYSMSSRSDLSEYPGFLIDDERIVGMKVGGWRLLCAGC
ncbi:hypothetical protein B0H21DRAFT_695505 [Amylocystis lapponica]|nr:hypothetical protein B0H21DRAFT_695505 [Amylocystis lapponica]